MHFRLAVKAAAQPHGASNGDDLDAEHQAETVDGEQFGIRPPCPHGDGRFMQRQQDIDTCLLVIDHGTPLFDMVALAVLAALDTYQHDA